MEFRTRVLQALVADLKRCAQTRAIWEIGSAATETSDQYSDLDINVVASDSIAPVFAAVQAALNSVSMLVHIWNEPKGMWPEITQKIYFLKDAPKHFFVDVAVVPEHAGKIIEELMQVERHGTPIVHFDHTGKIKARPTDNRALLEKKRTRLAEILEAFYVYRTQVLKEIDRGHLVDAFAFFQYGMVRPLVEVLGMIHRPYRFDFGLRYLKRDFPPQLYGDLERFLFVEKIDLLRARVNEVQKLFYESVETARGLLEG